MLNRNASFETARERRDSILTMLVYLLLSTRSSGGHPSSLRMDPSLILGVSLLAHSRGKTLEALDLVSYSADGGIYGGFRRKGFRAQKHSCCSLEGFHHWPNEHVYAPTVSIIRGLDTPKLQNNAHGSSAAFSQR